MWMGMIWILLGLFFLISSKLGRGGFVVGGKVELGWIVLGLGIMRLWWWNKTVREPSKRRLEFHAEVREMERERLAYESSDAPNKEASTSSSR